MLYICLLHESHIQIHLYQPGTRLFPVLYHPPQVSRSLRVGKDEVTGEKVIIENQLEASNHDHLGKIITYASGLDANVIVWIVKEAREEHRSAVEWLNNNTSTNINFFLIEVHAYKIGDSNPAPMFEVVEKPTALLKMPKISRVLRILINRSLKDLNSGRSLMML